jgi:hypothetical protein
VKLGKGGNWVDWFFLAMTCWQQGEREQARAWYARAARAAEALGAKHQGARRLRAEAEALLGAPP